MEVSAPPWIMILKVKDNLITTDNHQSPAWFLLASHLDESSCHDTQKHISVQGLCGWYTPFCPLQFLFIYLLDCFPSKLGAIQCQLLGPIWSWAVQGSYHIFKLQIKKVGCNNILLYNINLCRMFHDNFWKSVVPGEGGRAGEVL